MSDSERITISLFGAFRVASPDGASLTPTGAKPQALIALLATDKHGQRGRVWLKDKLWSDRGQQQASGSLRQALLEIRQAFGDWARVLLADRSTVTLDPERFTLAPASAELPGEDEFLLGIDVRDAEFEDWLRQMRAYYASQRSRPAFPVTQASPLPSRHADRCLTVVFLPSRSGHPEEQLLEVLFIDMVSRYLREVFDLEILTGMPLAASGKVPGPGSLLIPVQAFTVARGRLGLRAGVEEVGSLRSYWADWAEMPIPLPLAGENVPCLGLAHRTVHAISEVVSRRRASDTGDRDDADILAAMAFRRMFTMRHAELEAAEALLVRAEEVRPRGLYHAWRAQLAVLRHVERHSTDIYELRQKSELHCALALEAEPLNSNVLAAVSTARHLFENDLSASTTLAHQSVVANRANPLAWWAWANVALYAGRPDAAHAAAITAQQLADRSSLKFWADFQRSLTAAVAGQLREAIDYGTSASALAPSFRPPLRYLIALLSRTGRHADAARTTGKLLRLEAGFSPERLLNDPEYPVSIMRKAGIVDAESLAPLIG